MTPATPSREPAPVLVVRQLNVWHGGAQALFDVSLQVGAGELVVLQGLNGAGKSTLLQAIMGLSPRVTGVISYEKCSIMDWDPPRRAQAGLGFVAEDRRLFSGLTVQENLRVAARGPVPASEERVLALFPALKTMLRRRASQMSGGEQQMLAIGRGLMAEPRLLILDEPSLGLSPLLVDEMFSLIRRLRADGLAILLVEQNVGQSLEIADRAYVMENGLIRFTGLPADLLASDTLRQAYLGM